MSATPMLSIIVPVYNAEKHLAACLDSLLNCGVRDIEIVVIDDGSTDGTGSVVASYGNDQRVRALRHPDLRNHGVSESRNLGMRAARGEFISFLDADDIVLPGRFAQPLQILNGTHELDGVFSSLEVVFSDADAESRWGRTPIEFSPAPLRGEAGIEALCNGTVRAFIPIVTFRKSVLSRSGGFDPDLRLSEDYDFLLRLTLAGNFTVARDEQPLVLYRRHGDNTWFPDENDALRDLAILANVARWARRQSWVSTEARRTLRRAFMNKLYHCFELLRRAPNRALASAALRTSCTTYPALILSKRFWSNSFRVLF